MPGCTIGSQVGNGRSNLAMLHGPMPNGEARWSRDMSRWRRQDTLTTATTSTGRPKLSARSIGVCFEPLKVRVGGQGSENCVTIHRASGCGSRYPLATILTPLAKPMSSTAAATHKTRPPIVNRRVVGSQCSTRPAIVNWVASGTVGSSSGIWSGFARSDLTTALQQRIVAILHYTLKPHGLLWLGASETIGPYRDLFGVQDATHMIFTKQPGATPPAGYFPRRLVAAASGHSVERPDRPGSAPVLRKEAECLLLGAYAPSGVLISVELEIRQVWGGMGAYLSPAPGQAS
jgi:hypothetical protein